MKSLIKILLVFVIGFSFLTPCLATTAFGNSAATINQDKAFENSSGLAVGSIGETTSIVIQAFLGLLGIVFVILIIYAGFTWMTAGGDESKIEHATALLKNAIIGLVITIAAYSITYFVFNALNSTGGSGGGNPIQTNDGG
jgi:cytochrome bd-type quinol oxidase subunit 2